MNQFQLYDGLPLPVAPGRLPGRPVKAHTLGGGAWGLRMREILIPVHPAGALHQRTTKGELEFPVYRNSYYPREVFPSEQHKTLHVRQLPRHCWTGKDISMFKASQLC